MMRRSACDVLCAVDDSGQAWNAIPAKRCLALQVESNVAMLPIDALGFRGAPRPRHLSGVRLADHPAFTQAKVRA